mgnify:CR=1 FL=1
MLGRGSARRGQRGIERLAQRAAGRLSRVETGNLQFYVLLAALGVVASLAWMWGHG